MPFSKPFKMNKRKFLPSVGIALHGERFHSGEKRHKTVTWLIVRKRFGAARQFAEMPVPRGLHIV
jgi:hypothetical protein